MTMHRCTAVILGLLALTGIARADSIIDTHHGSSVPVISERFGDPRDSGFAAFGQTFTIEGSEAVTVSDFSLFLAPDGGRGIQFPDFTAYILGWDAGAKKAIMPGEGPYVYAASAMEEATDSAGYTAYTVPVPDVVLAPGEYVAFFSGFGEFSSRSTERASIGGANAEYRLGNAVVSNASISSVQGLYEQDDAFDPLDVDAAFLLNVTNGGPLPTSPPGYAPEPSSLLMWPILGGVGLVYAWRRRRQRRKASPTLNP